MQISWISVQKDGRTHPLSPETEKGTALDLNGEHFSADEEEIYGMARTVGRICLDQFIPNQDQLYGFKCHATSICGPKDLQAESRLIVVAGAYLLHQTQRLNKVS